MNVPRAAWYVQLDHHRLVEKVRIQHGTERERLKTVLSSQRSEDENFDEEFKERLWTTWLTQKLKKSGNLNEDWKVFNKVMLKCAAACDGSEETE